LARGKEGTDGFFRRTRQRRFDQPARRKIRLSPFLVGALLVLAAACHKAEKPAEAEAPAPVQVTAVTQDTIRRIVSGDGVLYPKDQAAVSPKLAAPVTKFYVNRGD